MHCISTKFSGRADSLTVLLVSDLHWDNPHCNRELLKRHFDQAVAMNAPIISVGDLYCVMQGKYDKRSNKSDVRPEHQHGDYFDRLVNTAVDWFKPYSKHLVLLGQGNHETSVLARHESCLLDRLASGLRSGGGITRAGGYAGWVRFRITNCGKTFSTDLWYHHGFGGGGPVTQGKIDFNRYASYVDADVIACGHVHYKETFPMRRAGLTPSFTPTDRTMQCVRLGTYKDEWADGHGGFHIEKGRGPRPLGGYWMTIDFTPSSPTALRVTLVDTGA